MENDFSGPGPPINFSVHRARLDGFGIILLTTTPCWQMETMEPAEHRPFIWSSNLAGRLPFRRISAQQNGKRFP